MLRDHDKHRQFFKQTLPWYFRDQVTQTFSRDRDKILDQKIRQPRTGWPKFYFMVIQTKTSIFRISTFPKSICDTIIAKKVLFSLQNPFFGRRINFTPYIGCLLLAIPEFFAYNMCIQLLTTDSLFDVEKPKLRFSIFIDFYWFSMIYWFLLKNSCFVFNLHQTIFKGKQKQQ